MDDVVALVAGQARVGVDAASGGAIASFTFGGIDMLRPTPAGHARDVRAHACYPLVPLFEPHRATRASPSPAATYALARNFGDHPHAIHGVGWQRPWTVAARETTRALSTLDAQARRTTTARAWPWPFRATQSMSLRADPDERARRSRSS